MKNIRNFCIIAHIALDGEIVGNWHPSAKDGGIYARVLDHRVKVFTKWDPDKYYLGVPGDYLAVRADDNKDVYIIAKDIFGKTYEEYK